MKKKKIMIVDDEEHFLMICRKNIEETGEYEVLALNSPEGILEKVKDFKPQVILLDIMMPKIDGVEACEILHSDPVISEIPVIILSALDADKYKSMMRRLGVVDFLVKPLDKDEIIAKIEKAIDFKKN